MKRKKHKLIAFGIFILFSSCSSIEIFKEKTEFKPYKKYQNFVILNNEVGLKGFNDDLLNALVGEGLKNALEKTGMRYETENPELVIRYTSNEDLRQREIFNNMYPMWGWRVWDPFMIDPRMNNRSMYSTKNYELLQLIVDFIDPKNDKILMQLTAVSEVHQSNEKKKKLEKSVEKIVESYLSHVNQN
jgi:hypothetical protein